MAGQPPDNHGMPGLSQRYAGPRERGTTSPDSYAVTTACVLSRNPSLLSTRLTCVFTVSSVTTSRAAISGLDRPSATSRRTCLSRGVSLASAAVGGASGVGRDGWSLSFCQKWVMPARGSAARPVLIRTR